MTQRLHFYRDPILLAQELTPNHDRTIYALKHKILLLEKLIKVLNDTVTQHDQNSKSCNLDHLTRFQTCQQIISQQQNELLIAYNTIRELEYEVRYHHQKAEPKPLPPSPQIHPATLAAKEMGRLGGKARAQRLSPEQRRLIAVQGGLAAREARKRKHTPPPIKTTADIVKLLWLPLSNGNHP